ncbi:hypothetical protein COU78_00220 [Candidatus Peregrinibacteria bacterium CG10_big_fil_rev_8_21_14_0_10_49_24]|nr:MAG: hypothetical protein COV83_06265 [Candidatus Peregrinibacteria bacterium CG11_big_fil_rev_8_21_14_0_20_49_14]PIR51669.1 MAG: hypothetical protein COU78_00220 [Candidatus Peregrinibacteria bacterium CG10_big_fil_rev_8_21_14_0_10_49_24]PJA68065.1 MAG: hypothetical protein CO157_01740 [Candidatus Peregrinibacteria bacterium CG_4_9_14_3_um_filter_49_12]
MQELRQNGTVRFYVRAVPGAAQTNATEVLEDQSVKVRVAAPPEGGKANAALLKYLAKEFAVSMSQVRIVSGHAARIKLIEVTAAS